jgi:hypothetical protein
MAWGVEAAEAIKAELEDAGIVATLDVTEVLGSAPCVLIPPPRWDDWQADGSPMFTWRLIAVSSQDVGNLDAWRELDDFVTAVSLVLPVELAEPIAYAFPATGSGSRPAYALTFSGR